ncbi:MAG: FHA domain-containing protein [Planctomycetaceae bacterium]|nr:FHA domain-containing protein [Planctomycetaceae bacterium]
MLAQLVPVEGGKPITLKRDVIVVGRKPGLCDLIVERPSVSKLHCVLVKTDGLLFVRDLGSTNGTKVNGQRVTRGALLPGDELAFASVRFRVHLGPDPSEPEPEDEALAGTLYDAEAAADFDEEFAGEAEDVDDEDAGENDEPIHYEPVAAAPDPSIAMRGDDTSDSDVRMLEGDSDA